MSVRHVIKYENETNGYRTTIARRTQTNGERIGELEDYHEDVAKARAQNR